jgi:tricorn protease
VAGARTPDEMRRVIGLMIGELNASHTGISAGGPPPGTGGGPAAGVGKLGLRFDRAAYDATGQLKVSEVIPLSPAAIAGVAGGETVAAVDGVTVTPRTTCMNCCRTQWAGG